MTSATHTYEPASDEEWRRGDNGGRSDDGERLAKALGVFSVGLGLLGLRFFGRRRRIV